MSPEPINQAASLSRHQRTRWRDNRCMRVNHQALTGQCAGDHRDRAADHRLAEHIGCEVKVISRLRELPSRAAASACSAKTARESLSCVRYTPWAHRPGKRRREPRGAARKQLRRGGACVAGGRTAQQRPRRGRAPAPRALLQAVHGGDGIGHRSGSGLGSTHGRAARCHHRRARKTVRVTRLRTARGALTLGGTSRRSGTGGYQRHPGVVPDRLMARARGGLRSGNLEECVRRNADGVPAPRAGASDRRRRASRLSQGGSLGRSEGTRGIGDPDPGHRERLVSLERFLGAVGHRTRIPLGRADPTRG